MTTVESAEALATHFSLSFAQCHHITEENHLFLEQAMQSDNESGINDRFTLQELRSVIKQLPHQSSPG